MNRPFPFGPCVHYVRRSTEHDTAPSPRFESHFPFVTPVFPRMVPKLGPTRNGGASVSSFKSELERQLDLRPEHLVGRKVSLFGRTGIGCSGARKPCPRVDQRSVVSSAPDDGEAEGFLLHVNEWSLPGWFLANGCQPVSMPVNGCHIGCTKTLKTKRFGRFANPGAGVRFPPPPL